MWTWILYIGVASLAVIYILLVVKISAVLSVVLADICNCSYLKCQYIFCVLTGFLQRMFLFAYSSMHKFSFFPKLIIPLRTTRFQEIHLIWIFYMFFPLQNNLDQFWSYVNSISGSQDNFWVTGDPMVLKQ